MLFSSSYSLLSFDLNQELKRKGWSPMSEGERMAFPRGKDVPW